MLIRHHSNLLQMRCHVVAYISFIRIRKNNIMYRGIRVDQRSMVSEVEKEKRLENRISNLRSGLGHTCQDQTAAKLIKKSI